MLQYRAFLEKGVLLDRGALADQHPLYVASMFAIMEGEQRVFEEQKRRADAKSKR